MCLTLGTSFIHTISNYLLIYTCRLLIEMMNTSEVYNSLQTFCKLGIVNKENIDIRVLLALTQMPEDEAREHLQKLEKHNYVSMCGDSINVTNISFQSVLEEE